MLEHISALRRAGHTVGTHNLAARLAKQYGANGRCQRARTQQAYACGQSGEGDDAFHGCSPCAISKAW
jgi:hypothetical protein